jgi:MinD-like ATPase involved in chromosome partitioning or flagellar assembly
VLIACWSPKGGSGTTVVACGLALVLARSTSVAIADLAGDVPATLGLPEPEGPGLLDWLAAGDDVAPQALSRLAVEVRPGLTLLPRGSSSPWSPGAAARGEALAVALRSHGDVVVSDCGRADVSEALALVAGADESLLVVRPCYLALRRALEAPVRPSGVVLVNEPGRALTARDVEEVLGVPVRAELPVDPAVARAVDAGLLARRPPRVLRQALQGVAA